MKNVEKKYHPVFRNPKFTYSEISHTFLRASTGIRIFKFFTNNGYLSGKSKIKFYLSVTTVGYLSVTFVSYCREMTFYINVTIFTRLLTLTDRLK